MDLLVDDVERSCWRLPQADVQMRLLANAITVVSSKQDFDTIVAAAGEFGFHDTFLMLGGRRC